LGRTTRGKRRVLKRERVLKARAAGRVLPVELV